MNWSNDMCPVSDEPAQEAVPRMGDFVEFICPTCGRFRISGTALETIRGRDADGKLNALAQAKRVAKDGEIPMITSYHL